MPTALHPEFDPVTQTWFAPGVKGDFDSLADMKRITKRKIIGYYPDEYTVKREPVAPDRPPHRVNPQRTMFK